MSTLNPLDPDLVYRRDATFWANPSTTLGHAYHRPSATNEGWAACSSRILLMNAEDGIEAEYARRLGLLCQRPACRKDR